MKEYSIYKNKYYWINIILIYCIFMSFITVKIDNNNFIYGIEHLHQYDQSLFENNPLIGEITPRCFMNIVVSGIMRIFNVSWVTVAVAFLFISIVPYAFAITRLCFNLFPNRETIMSMLLTILLLFNVTGGLALTTSIVMGSMGIGIGIGFALWAISFVLGDKKNWDAAWILIGISAFWHVHEGIWGGVLLCVIFLVDLQKSHFRAELKNLRVIWIWILSVLANTLPALIKAESLNISNREFVNIYAKERIAWHLWVSSFGWDNIFYFFMLLVFPIILYAFFLLTEKRQSEIKKFLYKSFVLLFTWIGAILFEFVFTEMIPIATVPTLFVTKYLKFISTLAIILYVKLVYELCLSNKIDLAFSCYLFAYTAKNLKGYAVIALILLMLLMKYYPKIKKNNLHIINLILILILHNWMYDFSWQTSLLILIGCLIELLPILFTKKEILYYAVSMVFILSCPVIAAYGRLYDYQSKKLAPITPDDYLIASTREGICELASQFRQITDKNEIFLCDPNDENGGWFQILSQRNCYNLWKTIPASKAKIKQWYDCYLKVKDLFNKDLSEIEAIMREIQCDYILVPVWEQKKFSESENFEMQYQYGKYIIYKINAE